MTEVLTMPARELSSYEPSPAPTHELSSQPTHELSSLPAHELSLEAQAFQLALTAEPTFPVTFQHDCVCELAEILGLDMLTELRKSMVEGHVTLKDKTNRIQQLIHLCRNTKSQEIRTLMIASLQDPLTRQLITRTLNNPTYEAFRVLDAAGLPGEGSVIFNSTATANSGNDNAILAALQILRAVKDTMAVESCGTCCSNGYTEVSFTKPKYEAVQFDPHTPYDRWSDLSFSLARQFYKVSAGGEEWDPDTAPLLDKYTHIYHWGCISQHWTKGPLGRHVSSWKLHERWNLVITMSMMWHAVATLRQGGQLCLKVRVMRAAETLGVASLLADLFDETVVLDNARQQCSFGIVIYKGFNASQERRRQMLQHIQDCMLFNPSSIFCNPVMRVSEKCRITLQQCEQIRERQIMIRARVNTVFLAGLHCLKDLLLHNNKRSLVHDVLPLLVELYGEETGGHFLQKFLDAPKQFTPGDKYLFVRVMNTRWMADNV